MATTRDTKTQGVKSSSGKNIHQRLLEAGMSIPGIEKKGKNRHFNYKFIREVDVTTICRKALADAGVLFYPDFLDYEVKEKGVVVGRVRGVFVNIDVPTDRIEMTTLAGGQDPGEKGPYKLMTGAVKYLLLKGLNLPTEEDPEYDGEPDDKPGNEDEREREPEKGRRREERRPKEDDNERDDMDGELDDEQQHALNAACVKAGIKRKGQFRELIGYSIDEVTNRNYAKVLSKLKVAADRRRDALADEDDGPDFGDK